MSLRTVGLARLLFVAYLVLLAWSLLSPTSTAQSGAVARLVDLLNLVHPPPGLITYDRGEVVMNAVIVLPVGFLGSFIFPGLSWRAWTAYGFVASLSVEVFQGLVLPGRQAAYSDVVANTAGILVGAVLYRAIRPMLRHRRTR